jgi:peptidoglycan/LPS O-acetylase OafA/YrhL
VSASKRNPELDGLRAFGVAGVMWLHWAPKHWVGWFPFELGLFFFLTLTGYLITRSLLDDASRYPSTDPAWREMAFLSFIKRRMARILLPCYAAMAFALVVGAPDIRAHPWWYVAHLSNFHIAFLEAWPSGTAHYWTLAIQVQFYLAWPWVVWLSPPKRRVSLMIAIASVAVLSRLVMDQWLPVIRHPEAIPFAALDYLSIGGLLAVLQSRGIDAGDGNLGRAAWLAFGVYLVLYAFNESGHRVPVLWPVGQTCLAVAMIGLISASMKGIRGVTGVVLRSRPVQHIGKISYGLYLFHTPVPLFLGHTFSLLWDERHPELMVPLRLVVFALVSWLLAWLCWWFLEGGSKHSLKQTGNISS